MTITEAIEFLQGFKEQLRTENKQANIAERT